MLTVITHSHDFYLRLDSAYFKQQGIPSSFYTGELNANTTSVMLVEPFFIDGEWLQLADLWHKLLLNQQASTKLLIARFEPSQSNNELDLLDLPTDLPAFISQALPVGQCAPKVLGGMTLVGKFRKFLDGHGEESLLKLITQLRSSFDTALFMLDDGSDFDEVWESMLKVVGEMIGKQLVERWEKYRPYFKPTPFYNQLQAYDQEMFERLVAFFTENPNEATVRILTPKLTELSQFLREIDEGLS